MQIISNIQQQTNAPNSITLVLVQVFDQLICVVIQQKAIIKMKHQYITVLDQQKRPSVNTHPVQTFTQHINSPRFAQPNKKLKINFQQRSTDLQMIQNKSAFTKQIFNQNLQPQQRFGLNIRTQNNKQTQQQRAIIKQTKYDCQETRQNNSNKQLSSEVQKQIKKAEVVKVDSNFDISKPQRRFQHFPFQEIYTEYIPQQVTYVEFVPVQRVKNSCYSIQHLTQYYPKQIVDTVIDYVPRQTTKFRKQYRLLQKRIIHMPIQKQNHQQYTIKMKAQKQQSNNQLKKQGYHNFRFQNSIQLHASQIRNSSEIHNLIGLGRDTERWNLDQVQKISPFKELDKQFQQQTYQKPLIFPKKMVTSDIQNQKFKQLIRSLSQSIKITVNKSKPINLPRQQGKIIRNKQDLYGYL